MDPMTIGMLAQAAGGIGGGAASLGGSIVGRIASEGDRRKAAEAYQSAIDEIMNIGAPPDVAREIMLEKFEIAGVLTPAVEEEINLGISKLEQVQEDPSLKVAQMSALEKMSQRAEGGLTPEDRAALNQARAEIAGDTQARDAQILQSMQQRGMGGAGNELAARLAGSQAAATRGAESSDRMGAMASERALQAAAQMGSLGSQIRGQDFGIEAQKASAADEVSKFNIANAVSRQTRNVGGENEARQFNTQRSQTVSDKNIAAANAEKERQRQAEQWMYGSNLQRAGMRSGAMTGQGDNASASAKDTQGFYSGIGSSVGQMLGGAGKAAGAAAKS